MSAHPDFSRRVLLTRSEPGSLLKVHSDAWAYLNTDFVGVDRVLLKGQEHVILLRFTNDQFPQKAILLSSHGIVWMYPNDLST